MVLSQLPQLQIQIAYQPVTNAIAFPAPPRTCALSFSTYSKVLHLTCTGPWHTLKLGNYSASRTRSKADATR